MANRKDVAVRHTIVELYKVRGSERAVARELGIDRGTVRRYVRQWLEKRSGPAISTAGVSGGAEPNPAISTAGRRSLCEPFRDRIEEWLEAGLSAQRIYQDLVCETDFGGSYESVKRFAGGLRRSDPRRFERIESLPGEEAQVDFGSGPRIPRAGGGWRKTWFFRIVLCHSRKGYTEAVSSGHRDLHSLPGERLPALRRRAGDAGVRQPEGGGEAGGLVRSGTQPEDRVLRPPLRDDRVSDAGWTPSPQRQGGKLGRLREGQRPQRSRLR